MSTSNWLELACIVIAVWLGWDTLFGWLAWRGLRSTFLPVPISFSLVVISVLSASTLHSQYSLAAIPLALAVCGASILHWSIALVHGRAFTPNLWDIPGTWERHHTTAITIPIRQTTMPALFYEPQQPYEAALVLLHGAGAHKTFYAWPMIQGLLDAGFAVCAVDLDGHGENERVLDVPSVLECPSAAVVWLRQRVPWVGIVGISLGGCVAARAVAEGLAVDALALLEAPFTIDVTQRTIRHEYRTLLRLATWNLHRYGGTVPLAQAWATHPTRTRIGTVGLIDWLDLKTSLQQIPVPLWLGYGDNDGVIPTSELHKIRAAAPQDASFFIARRATHLSLPIDPRAINALQRWFHTIHTSPTHEQVPHR